MRLQGQVREPQKEPLPVSESVRPVWDRLQAFQGSNLPVNTDPVCTRLLSTVQQGSQVQQGQQQVLVRLQGQVLVLVPPVPEQVPEPQQVPGLP